MPLWAEIILIAEQFGVPPWEVIDNCSELWWGYINVFNKIRDKAYAEHKSNR